MRKTWYEALSDIRVCKFCDTPSWAYCCGQVSWEDPLTKEKKNVDLHEVLGFCPEHCKKFDGRCPICSGRLGKFPGIPGTLKEILGA